MLGKLAFTIGNQDNGYRSLLINITDNDNITVKVLRDGFNDPPAEYHAKDAKWALNWEHFTFNERKPDMKSCHKLSNMSWQISYRCSDESKIISHSGAFTKDWNSFINWLAEVSPDLDWDAYLVPERKTGEFIVCSVKFTDNGRTYNYWTEDESLSEGNKVRVPVGNYNQESVGVIVAINYYTRENSPFPIKCMKMILGKYGE